LNVRNIKRSGSFGTWKVISVYKAGSIAAAAIELNRKKIELNGVQEVGWE